MSKKMKVLKKVAIHPSSQFCPFLGPLAPAAAVKIPPGPHPALPGVPCRPLAWSVDPGGIRSSSAASQLYATDPHSLICLS